MSNDKVTIAEDLRQKCPLCSGIGHKERNSFSDPSRMRMGSCHLCHGTGWVRLSLAEAERDALLAENRRLKAPVSDVEWLWNERTAVNNRGIADAMTRKQVNALIAARADAKEKA